MLWADLKGSIPMWDEGQLSALALAGARVEGPPQEGKGAEPGWHSPVVEAAVNDGIVHGGAHG